MVGGSFKWVKGEENSRLHPWEWSNEGAGRGGAPDLIALWQDEPANDNGTPTGKLIKTKQGYGFEVARQGDYAWVDMGQKAPVTLRVEDITAA